MYLSRSNKLKGQKNYITYTFINGLGYSFMAETIIYLLAIHFGAGNMALGYISSAVYLTGLIVFFVPMIFPDTKIVTLFFVAWLVRGVVSLFYGLTPVLPDKAAVMVIILIYSLFCLLRNIAYPLNPVIQGIITKPSERGDFSAKIIVFLYASMTLSRFISFGVLSIPGLGEITGIMALLGLGIVLNTSASFAISRVPVQDRIEKKQFGKAASTFINYLRTPRHLVFILLYCGGMSLLVLFNFTIPFLSRVQGVPSNLIFIFTTVNFSAVIFSSRLIRPFLDRFGSKPILTLVNLVTVVLSILWFGLGVSSIPLWGYFLLGFISMFFIGMIRLLLERLVVNTIPEDDRIGFASTISVVFSIISLLVGLGGGGLADLSSSRFSHLVPHEYSLTFGFMGMMALMNFILSLFLKEGGSLPANQFLKTMVDPGSLRTIYNLDLLKRVSSHARKEGILIELEFDESNLATQEIRKRLHLATMRDKEMIIRSLFSCPRPELEDELIAEALDPDSWWRQSAIFALGAYPTEKSRLTLRKIFREKYPYLCSVAAKSMARIGDYSCHEKTVELLQREKLDVRTCINLVIALSMIEKDGRYWSTIFRLAFEKGSYRFIQSLMIIGSRRLSFEPPIEDLFFELNLSEAGGFDVLLEEMADLHLDEGEFAVLQQYIGDRDFYSLWNWCRNRCRKISLLEPYEPLRASIVSIKKRKISPTHAVAGMYFTMQLEKIHEAEEKPLVHKPE